jgi:hypothetical protein
MSRFTILLLATSLALLGAVEALTHWGFDRASKVQRLEVTQRRGLLAVNDSPVANEPHIAVLGNSLLLDGVDVSLLDEQLKPEASPVPYFVLATNYYDWFFGLKRLFAEGARPRFVLLGLSPNQFASPETRGDYAARYLFRRQDLMKVARVTHMDATTASGFFLSSVSEFYSTREITRSFVLNLTLPSVSNLLHQRAVSYRDPEIPDAVLRPIAEDRLKAISDLCQANGSQFLLVIPPTYQKGSGTIAAVGRDLGVPVLVPVGDGVLDESFYQSDGVHLNDKGAQFFTQQLAANLKSELAELSAN